MGLENYPSAADWQTFGENFRANLNWLSRTITFRKFQGFSMKGATGIEQHRVPQYTEREEIVWLADVKVYDTVKGGYFTTGDLDIHSPFQIQGFSPAYSLPNGEEVSEYGGDEIIWNGKIWVPSDQIEPRPLGPRSGIVFWRTVLRVTQRSSQGLGAGAK